MMTKAVSTKYHPPSFLPDLPTMHLTASHGKLILLDWQEIKTQKLLNHANQHAVFMKPSQLDINQPDQAILLQTIEQLNEYFDGTRRNFSIPLDFSYGTQFQQQVWAALLTIDYGQTISYAKLATLIDKPKAFRACANANGKNPLSLIIPCHRVVASDGGLGGYTGGIAIKKTLLDFEMACHLSKNKTPTDFDYLCYN